MMDSAQRDRLRSLPSVSALLEHEEVRGWLHGLSRSAVVRTLQEVLDRAREDIRASGEGVSVDEILSRTESLLVEHMTPALRPVINATGIVLHTGLGRAPLCDAALDAIVEGASGYCNLELDLLNGRRGRRVDHVVELLREVTGAEAATVVNNNAAATLLVLKTLAEGREVIVSRGQLIEIGGSYRLPDIMRAGGVILREVGTTNRTRLTDYRDAINERTALLLRVHTSNYRVVGFTEEVAIDELVRLGHERGVPVLDDLGSGALVDLARYGLAGEPWVAASIRAGADLACCSGDKLLGGPQCGVIVGRPDLVQAIERSPLMRTYRVDKLTLLALEATLRHYLDADEAVQHIPALAMLTASTEDLAPRARALSEGLQRAVPGERFFVCSDVGFAGGGSLPAREIPTVVVQWQPASRTTQATVAALREGDPPVVARVQNDVICFDLRTIRDDDVEPLIGAIASAALDLDEPRPEDPTAIPLPLA